MAIEDILHPYLGRYLGSPRWLKASAGRAYSWLPPRVRLGSAYRRFLDEARAKPADVERLAREKLEATLRWAVETVPAYQRHRGLLDGRRDARDALHQLPVTDKLDIKRHPEQYLSRGMSAASRMEMFTGGSTHHPMQFYLHKHVTRPKEFAFIQDFRDRIGMDTGDMILALRGRTVPTAAQPGGSIWMYEPIKRQLILSSDHLERRFMPLYAEALALHRPRYVEAFPSALYPLARWLAANPLPEFTRGVKGVMLYSENVYPYQMEKFREVFGCPILSHYGHSERVLMAATMPEVLAAVRPLRAPRRGEPPGDAARQARLRRGHELRQQGDAVRALPHRRPRRALGQGAPGAAGISRVRAHRRAPAGIRRVPRPAARLHHHARRRALPAARRGGNHPVRAGPGLGARGGVRRGALPGRERRAWR
jgi:hypothetical protein